MQSFADIATQMNPCKIMAYAIPRFFQRTGINVEFRFTHDPKSNEMNVTVGFTDLSEPTEEHYKVLLEEMIDAEKLLMNEYIINNAPRYENLNQFVFKHKEETKQIIRKQREDV